MYKTYWRVLFLECIALFLLVFVVISGGLVCLALVWADQLIWLPLVAAITAVLCKLVLEIRA